MIPAARTGVLSLRRPGQLDADVICFITHRACTFSAAACLDPLYCTSEREIKGLALGLRGNPTIVCRFLIHPSCTLSEGSDCSVLWPTSCAGGLMSAGRDEEQSTTWKQLSELAHAHTRSRLFESTGSMDCCAGRSSEAAAAAGCSNLKQRVALTPGRRKA